MRAATDADDFLRAPLGASFAGDGFVYACPDPGLFVTILVLLRLEGVLALPIVLFMLALIVVAEMTLSAER